MEVLALLVILLGAPEPAPPELRLLATEPSVDPGWVMPQDAVRLVFDRPVARASLAREAIRFEYVDCPFTFAVDPSLHVGLAHDGERGPSVVVVDPPLLIPDQRFRIVLSDRLRAVDGSGLAADASADTLPPTPPELGVPRRVLSFRVPALP
jgi:hypothetical protein